MAWAIETGSIGTTIDPSTHKECRWSEIEQPESRQWCSGAEAVDDDWWQQTYTSHQWCHGFAESSASTWRPTNLIEEGINPHTVSAESGEGWFLPTDEAAMPKLQWDGRPQDNRVGEATPIAKPKWIPMSGKSERGSQTHGQGQGESQT